WKVTVLKGDGVEATIPVLERVAQCLLLSAVVLITHELTQITLTGNKAGHGQCTLLTGFNQLHHFLNVVGDKALVRKMAGQPEDQLIEEQDDRVVTERFGMLRHDA